MLAGEAAIGAASLSYTGRAPPYIKLGKTETSSNRDLHLGDGALRATNKQKAEGKHQRCGLGVTPPQSSEHYNNWLLASSTTSLQGGHG